MSGLTLSQVRKLLAEKEIIAIILLVLAIFGIGIFLFISSQNRQLAYKGEIYPGKTKEEKVKEILGKPIRTEQEENQVVYSFNSGNIYRPDKVAVEKGKVVLVEEQILKDDQKLKSFTDEFGKYEIVLYGKFGQLTPAYFWGKHGFLVFASPEKGVIYEIWYFKPMEATKFLQSRSDFSLQPTEHP